MMLVRFKFGGRGGKEGVGCGMGKEEEAERGVGEVEVDEGEGEGADVGDNREEKREVEVIESRTEGVNESRCDMCCSRDAGGGGSSRERRRLPSLLSSLALAPSN